MCMITTAIIGIGSNVRHHGEPSSALVDLLANSFFENQINIISQSQLWHSKAWPDPTQPDYINGVFVVETYLSAQALMVKLLDIERQFGRERSVPNAPRTLDLDLIAYGNQVINEPDLIVPHPRAADRRFVMGPLAQVLPDWIHPVLGVSALALFGAATVGLDAHPV
jgi:2-amino-4-hydroxy-6-hydroxymethyldihydropteridine diphosphokinase